MKVNYEQKQIVTQKNDLKSFRCDGEIPYLNRQNLEAWHCPDSPISGVVDLQRKLCLFECMWNNNTWPTCSIDIWACYLYCRYIHGMNTTAALLEYQLEVHFPPTGLSLLSAIAKYLLSVKQVQFNPNLNLLKCQDHSSKQADLSMMISIPL